jgi:hypothetical protein
MHDIFRIQPPGILHHVYTLENSIFTGGHFLNWDCMHHTELARIFAVVSKQTGTNASHPGVIRLLSRMAFALAWDSPRSSENYNLFFY